MATFEISQVRTLARSPLEQYVEAFSSSNVTAILDKYKISASPLRVCHFMAQVLTETGRLCILVENLHYSAKRLMAFLPKRFPTRELAREYEDDPEKLGNVVYANRMGDGDAASGDGFKYRGRGLRQITGKDAYARFGKQLGINLVASPELAYDPIRCLEIAAAEWDVSGYYHQFCNELADQDDAYGVTRAINGGLTGADQLQRCKKIWLPVPQLASRAASHRASSGRREDFKPHQNSLRSRAASGGTSQGSQAVARLRRRTISVRRVRNHAVRPVAGGRHRCTEYLSSYRTRCRADAAWLVSDRRRQLGRWRCRLDLRSDRASWNRSHLRGATRAQSRRDGDRRQPRCCPTPPFRFWAGQVPHSFLSSSANVGGLGRQVNS